MADWKYVCRRMLGMWEEPEVRGERGGELERG